MQRRSRRSPSLLAPAARPASRRSRRSRSTSSSPRSASGDAPDGHAPRLAAREELVGIDLAEETEEVRLGVVRGAAVDGGLEFGRWLVLDPARDLLGAPFRLLSDGSFHIAARHVSKVHVGTW